MSKVTVVGAGNVGATCANVLAFNEVADEVVMLDVKEGVSEGKAMDMMQTAQLLGFDTTVTGCTNDYEKTANSDVVVITSGIPRKPGMTREELIGVNAGIVKSVAQNILKYSPNAILVVISNPMDTMTYLSLKSLGLPKNRIIGMGGALDSSRFKYFLSQALGCNANEVEGMVIGGHGDTTMIPLARLATYKGNSHNGSWGNGIQMSEGHICINNTTLIDNMGTGAALNGGGSILLTNNTIIGNTSDSHGAVRCETGVGGDTKFINNLLLSENPSAPSFNLNGSNFEAFSKGYNVYQRVTGITMSASDTAYPNPVNGTLDEKGVYVWDLNQIGSVKGYATKQAVIEVAKSFNPVASPIANLGEVFVEWVGEDAFGIDQREVTRNANKMQAGAYDAVLTN